MKKRSLLSVNEHFSDKADAERALLDRFFRGNVDILAIAKELNSRPTTYPQKKRASPLSVTLPITATKPTLNRSIATSPPLPKGDLGGM